MSEIFRLSVKTLTHDEKYSRRNMQVFWQPLETPLSRKGKTIFLFFIGYLKGAWNWENSEKTEEYSSLFINEIIESERDVYLSV